MNPSEETVYYIISKVFSYQIKYIKKNTIDRKAKPKRLIYWDLYRLVGNGQTLMIKIDITSICKMKGKKEKKTILIFEAAI